MLKKIILGLVIIGIAILGIKWAAKEYRAQQGIFRFEDYRTAEEAKAALLKLHPVGSDAETLIATLKLAGAEIEYVDIRKGYKIYYKDEIGAYKYSYWKYNLGINAYQWSGFIPYDKEKKILNIGVGKMWEGL